MLHTLGSGKLARTLPCRVNSIGGRAQCHQSGLAARIKIVQGRWLWDWLVVGERKGSPLSFREREGELVPAEFHHIYRRNVGG